ncbi:MAG: ComF family protein [Candidatus Acidiferrum sp.]
MQTAESARRGVRGWLAEAGDAIVSLFFPAGCRICESLLAGASRVPICDECLSSFEAPSEKKCEICGQAVGWMTMEEERHVCWVCQQKTYAFERARSYGIYEEPLVRAILLLKWERIEPLGRWFAERLAEIAKREGETLAADIVVPVPLHRDRERERGYNQAGLISKPLALRLGLPHKAVLLMRTRPRPNKQVLSFEERWDSVRGAFATRPGSQVDNKRVLLVDDVMTTGATLDACARALLESGAKSVVALTVARAARNSPQAPDSGNL